MQRMKRARTMLLMHYPFFGYLAAKLKLVESDKYPTMATDGRHIFFNPKFTKQLSNNQTLTGMGHEVMHNACEHFSRGGTRDPEKWKKASDYAINIILKDAGFAPITIPGVFDWLFDEKYRGMTAERICDVLPQLPPCPSCVIIKIGSGDGVSAEDDQQPPQGGAGSGADDKAPPPPPVNWPRAIVEAAQFAKMRGKLPAGIEEMVDGIIHPKVNWKQIIRSAMTTAKKTDWTFRRPNRRYAHTGITLPTAFGYTTSVEWWGDSSGSIDATAWKTGLGICVDIAKTLRIRVDVGVCDAAVQLFEHDVKDNEIAKKVKFLGRGGTDFRPIFEHIKKGRRKPDCVVIWTDGYGSFPQGWRPPYQVIWAMPESSEGVEVPFGKKLLIDMKELKEQVA
jgi:predicted metal-dependent peptidase